MQVQKQLSLRTQTRVEPGSGVGNIVGMKVGDMDGDTMIPDRLPVSAKLTPPFQYGLSSNVDHVRLPYDCGRYLLSLGFSRLGAYMCTVVASSLSSICRLPFGS